MAEGAMHFRNRGQQNLVEITCWPKPKTHLLTTGAANNELKNLRYRSEYLYIAHVVNMTLAETANWVEAWQKEAKYLASRRQKLLETKLTVKKKGKFWTLQTQTREGVSTSAQRKFRAWEEAVRAVRAIDEAKATYDRIQKEK
jgi:capsule polysaccharide modification protein KpsS